MKNKILLILILFINMLHAFAQSNNKALLIIDIQDFYFPGGSSVLVEPEKAASNAGLLLESFRNENKLVIHVRHNSAQSSEIHNLVKPLANEKIISKDEVNCFMGTDLLEFLRIKQIDTLVICGMQTHMCVEAATRAAHDMGFKCILIHDACATKDLRFNNYVIKAKDVHNSTLSTLSSYASIMSTAEYLKQ
jgi:nicotinamidase-related amidase